MRLEAVRTGASVQDRVVGLFDAKLAELEASRAGGPPSPMAEGIPDPQKHERDTTWKRNALRYPPMAASRDART